MTFVPARGVPAAPAEPQTVAGHASQLPPDGANPDWDIVDEWGAQSFPASDPPANW